MLKKPDPYRSSERRVAEIPKWVKSSLDVSKTTVWEWNMVTGAMQWSDFEEAVSGPRSKRGNLTKFLQQIAPEDRSVVIAAFAEAIESRGIFQIEYRLLHQNDDIQWICCRGRAIYARSGAPLRIVGVWTDITRQKEIEHELRRSRDLFARLFQENTDKLSHITQQLDKATECLQLQDTVRERAINPLAA